LLALSHSLRGVCATLGLGLGLVQLQQSTDAFERKLLPPADLAKAAPLARQIHQALLSMVARLARESQA